MTSLLWQSFVLATALKGPMTYNFTYEDILPSLLSPPSSVPPLLETQHSVIQITSYDRKFMKKNGVFH